MTHTFSMPEMILSGENAIEEGMKRIPGGLKKGFIVTAQCNIALGFVTRFTEILKRQDIVGLFMIRSTVNLQIKW